MKYIKLRKKFKLSIFLLVIYLSISNSISLASMNSEMPYIYQTNYTAPYLDGTIASDGCGITSAAMAISYLTGTLCLPTQLTDVSRGNFVQAANKYGLKVTVIDTSRYTGNSRRKGANYCYTYYLTTAQKLMIIEALATGCPITNGTWGTFSYTGQNAHYVVLSGLSSSAGIYLHNPNGKCEKKAYTLNYVDARTDAGYFIFQKPNALPLSSYGIIYDYEYYVAHNNKVRYYYGNSGSDSSRYNVAKYFFTTGITAGDQASPFFNVRDYIKANSDVADYCRTSSSYDYKKALVHYCQYGYSEGRIAIDSHATIFNPKYYADNYSDLKAAYGYNATKLLDHFLNCGMKEGRQASIRFNVSTYMNRYPHLQTTYQNSLSGYYWHFARWGCIAGYEGT